MNKQKWVTIFPHSKNFHLIKDVGYIAYSMNKYYNLDSYLVTFNEDDYKYLRTYTKGLNIRFLNRKIKNDKLAILIYLLKNSRQIDFLHIFHFKLSTLMYAYIYKIINPKGKVYLKLDSDNGIINESLKKKKIKLKVKHKLLKYCNLISIESRILSKELSDIWSRSVRYIPNGFWILPKEDMHTSIKKNNIITVARLGTYQKNTELLVDAFVEIYKMIPEWNLYLIGSMTNSFEQKLKEVLYKNKDLESRIIITGNIDDLNELNKIYSESKIFCLPSRYEGFPLVFPEALKNGCLIISTDIPSTIDITNNGKMGVIFKNNDMKELSSKLLYSCKNYDKNVNTFKIKKYAHENFSWSVICRKIANYLDIEEGNYE